MGEATRIDEPDAEEITAGDPEPIKDEVLPIAEIERRYPDHWILLGDPRADASDRVTAGVVLYAGQDRDEMYRRAAAQPVGRPVAFRCTQPSPEDEVIIL